MKISNTTIKLAKQQFKSKIVEDAKYLLENETMAVIYGSLLMIVIMNILNNVCCLL